MTDLFTNARRFLDLEDWHREADSLRVRNPVLHVDRSADGFRPFWAVLSHAAVMDVERRPDLFTNEPDTFLARAVDLERQRAAGAAFRTLVQMDAPDHPKYRKLTADWFKPGSLGRLQPRLDELSAQMMSKLTGFGGECDFASDIAVWYPLAVILAILGLPEEDYPRMLRLTQEFFGSTPPPSSGGSGSAGPAGSSAAARSESMLAAMKDFYRYFLGLTAQRRSTPGADLATLIANGLIDGAPMPDVETVSYYVIVATAGHDTTSSSITGGLQALVEHPAELARIQTDPTLLNSACDEMIRWVSPARHFMRTVAENTEIAGTPVRKGDWVYLSYLAANRDPAVFEDPHRFDVGRPNADKHLAFGFGAHFCLGAQLARMELRTVFRSLVPALADIELASPPQQSKTIVVGGTTSLPIRYRIHPS